MSEDAAVGGVESSSSSFGAATADESQNDQVANLMTLLTLNRAYQEAIVDKLAALKTLLAQNQLKQEELNNRFNYNAQSKKASGGRADSLWDAEEAEEQANSRAKQNDAASRTASDFEFGRIKGNYFKDRFLAKATIENPDSIRKKSLQFYDYVAQLKTDWSMEMRIKLRNAVKTDAIRLIKTPFLNRIPILRAKLKRFSLSETVNKEEYKASKNMLKEAQLSLKNIDSMSEANIVNQVDVHKIDWMKISNIDLDGNWSSNECRLVWQNVCNPNINQEKWTSEENTSLHKLARKYRERNWEQVALELNTKRSAYLCMKRYHEKTADKYCKRDWSDEEVAELVALAQVHRIGTFIPFNYLCYLNGTRDRNNVNYCYTKHNPDLQRGHWSPTEIQAFDEAIQLYNNKNCWQEIAEYVGTRTALQCRDRYELKYLNPDKYTNWTADEDKRLLESYTRYEGRWNLIVRYDFPNRTDHSCLFRYRRLIEWQKQNAWFEKQESEVKEFLLCIYYKKGGAAKKPNGSDGADGNNEESNDSEEVTMESVDQMLTVPKFSPNSARFSANYNKVLEKKELIIEFIRKKRQGVLDFELVKQIGIYTSGFTAFLNDYKHEKNVQTVGADNVSAMVKLNRKQNAPALLQQPKKSLKASKKGKQRGKLKAKAKVTKPKQVTHPKAPDDPGGNQPEAKQTPKSAKKKGAKKKPNVADVTAQVDPESSEPTQDPAPSENHYIESINQTIFEILNKPPEASAAAANHEDPVTDQPSVQPPPQDPVTQEASQDASNDKLQSSENLIVKKKRGPYKKQKQPAKHLSAILKEREKVDTMETNSNSENICTVAGPTQISFATPTGVLTVPVTQKRATNLQKDQFIELIKIQQDLKNRQVKPPSAQNKPMKISQILQTMNPEATERPSLASADAATRTEGDVLVTYLDSLISNSDQAAADASQGLGQASGSVDSTSESVKEKRGRKPKDSSLAEKPSARSTRSSVGATTSTAFSETRKRKRASNAVGEQHDGDQSTVVSDSADASINTTLKAKRGRKPKYISKAFIESSSSNESSPVRNARSRDFCIDIDSIAEDTKIPCIVEELNEFKYLYSMKKSSNSTELFQKFVFIKLDNQLVAIKRLSHGQMDASYLNEENMNKIREVMKKIALESTSTMMTRQTRKKRRVDGGLT